MGKIDILEGKIEQLEESNKLLWESIDLHSRLNKIILDLFKESIQWRL
ncbi:hypothetical protein LCGC14_1907920 [marine sediment metagenome]|uniref:Uncharacterized protein n=1 Tax=marine sediment metagenome TaxID=412755 RepID=A0A0F9ISJ2_9ZZZZ